MSLKVKIKTKKHCITWNINKFINNIIAPLAIITMQVVLGIETLLKLGIFEIY